VHSLCPSGDNHAPWIQSDLPPVSLAGGAKLYGMLGPNMPSEIATPKSTTLLTLDVDGDGKLDLLVNDRSGQVHVAYGLGDGRFHSTSPPADPPDQMTSVIADRASFGVEGDFVFAAWPGENPSSITPHTIFKAIPCPAREAFGSAACSRAMTAACTAHVGDVDGNGLPDVVFTEPELPNFLVFRGTAAGDFVASSHATTCPPRRVSLSDLDGDGLDDVALVDSQPDSATTEGAPTTQSIIKVAFGSPASPPSDARVVATFDPLLARPSDKGLGRDQSLVAGSFLGKELGSQLAVVMTLPSPNGPASTDGALAGARLERAAGRLFVAPYYFPELAAEGEIDKDIHVTQVARGAFAGATSVAAVTTHLPLEASAPESLWLLDTSATASAASPTPRSIDCHGCALATIDVEDDGQDELAALGDGSIAIYRAETDLGFGEPLVIPTAFDFRDPEAGQAGRMPRPVVADLDGDGRLDVLAMTSAGELVAAWGTGGAGAEMFKIQKLLDRACGAADPTSCSTLPSFAVLQADKDPLPEVAVVAPDFLHLYAIRADRALHETPAELAGESFRRPPQLSDYVAVVAGDFDGDGVDDLAIAGASSSFTVLRGLPEIE
jgi:hypothetical protein